MSRLCGEKCACKIVDRSSPLDADEIAIMRMLAEMLSELRCGGMAQHQAEVMLEGVKCWQPRWAHLLSLPFAADYCNPYTLLYGSVRIPNLQWLTPWLLNQGVCLYSGYFEFGKGWMSTRPHDRPPWTESKYYPLEKQHFRFHEPRRLLLAAGVHPALAEYAEPFMAQWNRWHGRNARRATIKVLCAWSEM
jgi:hypothetical protein